MITNGRTAPVKPDSEENLIRYGEEARSQYQEVGRGFVMVMPDGAYFYVAYTTLETNEAMGELKNHPPLRAVFDDIIESVNTYNPESEFIVVIMQRGYPRKGQTTVDILTVEY